MNELLSKAVDLYEKRLWSNPSVLNYLTKERGLLPQTIKQFKIGYCNNDLTNTGTPGNSHKLVSDYGDYFNGYITFPILKKGEPISMYGRGFSTERSPHLNYRDLDKSFPYNGDALEKSGYVIVVESPIDAITLQQAGYSSIALLGSSMVDDSVELFKGKVVYLLFDTDDAGAIGEAKVSTKLYPVAKEVHILKIPGKIGIKQDANSFFLRVASAKARIKLLMENSDPISEPVFLDKIYKEKNKKIKNEKADSIDIKKVAEELLGHDYKVDNSGWWYICPHHKEGTETYPSLWVGGNKNIFSCFGCNEGGGPIYFVKWHLGITFEEARKWLEERFLVE